MAVLDFFDFPPVDLDSDDAELKDVVVLFKTFSSVYAQKYDAEMSGMALGASSLIVTHQDKNHWPLLVTLSLPSAQAK